MMYIEAKFTVDISAVKSWSRVIMKEVIWLEYGVSNFKNMEI